MAFSTAPIHYSTVTVFAEKTSNTTDQFVISSPRESLIFWSPSAPLSPSVVSHCCHNSGLRIVTAGLLLRSIWRDRRASITRLRRRRRRSAVSSKTRLTPSAHSKSGFGANQ